MLFKDQLKSAMKEQGIRFNNAAASKCNLCPQQFGKYINGKATPSFNDGVKILRCLNWDVIAFPQKK